MNYTDIVCTYILSRKSYAFKRKMVPLRLRLHNEGHPQELHGHCVYIHPVTKELRIQKKDCFLEKIQFDEIIDVIVED
jgi:hypothetical protein